MALKTFFRTSAIYGLAMALILGFQRGVVGVVIGLSSGLVFGLVMTGVVGGIRRVAGNKPVHAVRELYFDGKVEQAVQAVNHALLQVGGRNIKNSSQELTASMPMTWRSFGELVSVEVAAVSEHESMILIRSSPRVRRTIADYGKNQSNVVNIANAILPQPTS